MIATKQQATQWAEGQLIPFLKESSEELGAPVDRLVLATIVRRAAIKGADLQDLLNEVEHHFNHQMQYERNRSRH